MIYDDLKLGEIPGWMLPEECEWLYEQAKDSINIIEIGCFLGRSTCALAAGIQNGSVYTVDTFDGRNTEKYKEMASLGCNEMRRMMLENLSTRKLFNKVNVIRGRSRKLLTVPQFFPQFAFIDGSHEGADVREDLLNVAAVLAEGGLVAGHDFEDDRPDLQAAVLDFCGGEPEKGPGTIWYCRI